MKNSNGYYSLIQFCPDRSRLEAANIGVLLFCPERHFIKARIAKDNDRIRRFFGAIPETDWEQVNAAKDALVERLEIHGRRYRQIEDLSAFIATRANQIVITTPRPMRVSDPAREIEKLFAELVGPEQPQRPRVAPASLRRRLHNSLEKQHLDDYVRKNIDVPTPMHRRPLRIPFAFKNGKFNLIFPTSFEFKDVHAADNKACRLAVEGRYLSKNPDPEYGERQLHVVGQFNGSGDIKKVVEEILALNEVRLFDFREINPLLDLIRRTAEPQVNALWSSELQAR